MRISLKRIIVKVIAYCFPPKFSLKEKQWWVYKKKFERTGMPWSRSNYLRYLAWMRRRDRLW